MKTGHTEKGRLVAQNFGAGNFIVCCIISVSLDGGNFF